MCLYLYITMLRILQYFCRNVLQNFIYMKVLQECSSIIWLECSIFNTPPHSQSDIFLNLIILLNLANYISPIPFANISAIISSLLQFDFIHCNHFSDVIDIYIDMLSQNRAKHIGGSFQKSSLDPQSFRSFLLQVPVTISIPKLLLPMQCILLLLLIKLCKFVSCYSS